MILAKTIKGYGLGEAGEGKNITHQQKKLNDEELREFRAQIRHSDLRRRRRTGAVLSPARRQPRDALPAKSAGKGLGGLRSQRAEPSRSAARSDPRRSCSRSFYEGSDGREASTTMVFVRMLSKMLQGRDRSAKLIVPIVPDEARTFGMEALFRQVGIYSHVGQRYEPVDRETLLYYKEATDGADPRRGDHRGRVRSVRSSQRGPPTRPTAGERRFRSSSSTRCSGSSASEISLWAAGDMGCRGFLIGGTSGRTTLAGEGLQHQDGHSHLLAYTHPHVVAYDPAFAYELAVLDRGRNPPDVRRARERLLLPHGRQRAVRRCRRCPRAAGTGSCAGCIASASRAPVKSRRGGQAPRQRVRS